MRSKWKLPFTNFKLLHTIKQEKDKKKKDKKAKAIRIVLKSRSLTITPEFLNCEVKIYNGIKFFILPIQEHHLGYKFGNFSITKKRCIFKKSKKQKK